MLVWIGSVLALVTSAVLGIQQLDQTGLVMIICATVTYLVGVQLPTVSINVPLNNEIQTLDVDTMNAAERKAAREEFEPRWNQWNMTRTVLSILVSTLLIVLLLRI